MKLPRHTIKLLYFGEFAQLNDTSNIASSDKIIISRRKFTSDFPGVSRKGEKWIAQIGSGKNRKYLGTFATEQEVIAARKKAEIELRN